MSLIGVGTTCVLITGTNVPATTKSLVLMVTLLAEIACSSGHQASQITQSMVARNTAIQFFLSHRF